MKLHYDFPITCDVCGGECVGSIKCAGASWIAGTVIRHVDPAVCAWNLKQQKAELEKEKSELKKHSNF